MESQVCTLIKDPESKSVIHIPQEITENILTRLPRKSLVRFESVGKSWRSWLTNPDFRRRDAQSLLLISPSKGGFFQTTTEQGTQTEKFPLPWADSKSIVSVSNSCNGMVLIGVGNCFYLFNPSTHFFAKVLTLDYMSHNDCEESHYHLLIGLYYDEAISDYKAVVLIQYGIFISSAPVSILVEASLKGKQWNHIDHNNIRFCHESRVGPVVNGRLHWLNKSVVFRFDPVLKVFEELPSFQPPRIRKKDKIVGIGILEGCLCVSRFVNKKNLEILAMKEYGVLESWTPILTSVAFSMKESINMNQCNPLLLTRAGEILISIRDEYFMRNEIFWVNNLRKKTFEKYLTPEKEISTRAVSFVQNMDTPSGY